MKPAIVRAWRVIASIALLEAGLSWLLAWRALDRALRPIAWHPDGVRALFDDGSRGLLELLLRHSQDVTAAAIPVAAALGLYALISTWLTAALCASLAGSGTVIASTFRRTPTLLALALFAIAGYAVAAVTAAGAVLLALRVTPALTDERVADVTIALAPLPALVLALVVFTVHDAARFVAVATGSRALAATRAAMHRVTTAAGRTSAGLALTTAVSLAAGLAGLVVGRGVSPTGAVLSLALLSRALLLVMRVLVRAIWLAWLGGPWTRRSAA